MVLAKLAAGNTACVEEVPNIPVSQLNELMMELPFYNQSVQAIGIPTSIFQSACTTVPDWL